MDDRFDFVLMSKSLKDAQGLHYVANSYKAFGNNGNCFNRRIDDTACAGVYDFPLRRNLHNMSDHTPVVLQLAYPAQALATAPDKQQLNGRLLSGNIVNSQLVVQTDIREGALLQLRVINNLGQVMKSLEHRGTKIITIGVQDLPAGLYYLQLVSGRVRAVLKFIKR